MLRNARSFTQYYDVIGQGTPLLCLPAFPYTHLLFQGQRVLADQARLILPDYRGTGNSTFSEGPYTMDLLADDMLELLDTLEIEQTVILGVSMGCYVAFALYARHPERVRGLILADSRAEADSTTMADSRQKTVATLHSEGISVLCEGISTLLSSTSRSQHPEFISELRAQIKDDDAAGFAEITRGLAMRKDRQELLAQICVPTLVLCGEEDTVSPPNGMRDMAERIPRATFHLIPAAGHLSPWEQPETFNNAIRAFWAKL